LTAKQRAARDRRLRQKYGLTLAQYDEMLRRQKGVCKICERPPKTLPLHVDHDHPTGRVRGLLCFRCNKLRVGPAKDSEWRLYERVYRYLHNLFDGRHLLTTSKEA
jgi:hypothetical protein